MVTYKWLHIQSTITIIHIMNETTMNMYKKFMPKLTTFLAVHVSNKMWDISFKCVKIYFMIREFSRLAYSTLQDTIAAPCTIRERQGLHKQVLLNIRPLPPVLRCMQKCLFIFQLLIPAQKRLIYF